MRVGLWALLALLLGAFAAHFLLADRGYVLINFRSYVVEMSVPGLVLVSIALYLAVRGLVALKRAPQLLGIALRDRRVRLSGAQLMRGMIHLTEGDWARGERLLTKGLKGSDAPWVNYLLAARAAQAQGSTERRDQWLKLAYSESPDGEAAVLLTQAELELDSGEHEAALATLTRLDELRRDHPNAVGLLARAYRGLSDAERLIELLPRLNRARLTPDARLALATEALQAGFARADLSIERVAEIWARLPNDLRIAPALVALRAIALDRCGRGDEAERELRAALKRDWHPTLVQAYGEVRGAEPAKQLKQAETWLESHPEDGALLLAAARLCIANELWGKARSYLESSLALAPVPDAYALYGQLLTQLGEGERAALAFRSGLGLVSPVDAKLPELKRPSLEPPAQREAEGEVS